MAIIQCDKGHYFDDDKFARCPHCNETSDEGGLIPPRTELGLSAEPLSNDEDEVRTMGKYSELIGTQKVTGWIVCVGGPEKGRDYRLRNGWNRIGKSISMEISIPDDIEIPENVYGAVVYEPKASEFYLVSNAGGIYLNGQRVDGSDRLQEGDNIQVGRSTLVFIPFCNKERRWK